MFGAGARDNFPSGFQNDPYGRAGGSGSGAAAMNLGGGADNAAADLERAIAASMEENVGLGGAGASYLDDDAELARILEASKHER